MNGSASMRSTLSGAVVGTSSRPSNTACSSSSEYVMRNGRTVTPGSVAAQAATAGASSTSRVAPITPPATHPRSTPPPRLAFALSTIAASSSSNCGATKRNARSGIAPASGSRAAPSAASAAARPERRVESPAPTRSAASFVVILTVSHRAEVGPQAARPA